jgi:hypothetical protein
MIDLTVNQAVRAKAVARARERNAADCAISEDRQNRHGRRARRERLEIVEIRRQHDAAASHLGRRNHRRIGRRPTTARVTKRGRSAGERLRQHDDLAATQESIHVGVPRTANPTL